MNTQSAAGAVIIPAKIIADEAATLLDLHPQTVRRLVREGKIRGGRVGRSIWLDGNSIAEYLSRAGIAARVEDVAL